MLTRRARVSLGPLTRRFRDDAGATLAELMVSMTLMTLVGAMALWFFVWTGHTTSQTTEQSFDTNDARIAITTLSGTLRLADSPTSGIGTSAGRVQTPLSGTSITFYANDNSNRSGSAVRSLPTKVTFTIANGALTELRYAPLSGAVAGASSWDSNYPTKPTISRTLLTSITAGSFSYGAIDQNGDIADVDLTKDTSKSIVVSVTMSLTTAGFDGKPAQTVRATSSLTGVTA